MVPFGLGEAFAFIDQQNDRSLLPFVPNTLDIVELISLADACAVHHGKDNIRLFDFASATLNAEALDGVFGLSQSCRIDEAEEVASDVHRVLDGVARGAVNIAHDGTLLAQQGIEQGTLAYVSRADNRHRNPTLDGIAEAIAVDELLELELDLVAEGKQFGTIGELHIFFGEIQFQLHQPR